MKKWNTKNGKKYCLIIKKFNSIYFLIYKYMNYYRKPIDKVANDVKLKMQLGALTLKISENNKKIDDLIGVDKNIKKDVSSNLEKIDNIKEFLISPENFKKTFNIEKQIFRFNRTRHFYVIFEKEITHDFVKNSLLFINNSIQYKYENLLNDYHRLQHEYNIYDDENNLIYKYLFNKDTYYDEKKNPILLTIDDFCIYFKKNYKKIKVILLLHRHNRHGLGNIDLEIDDNNDNYININYVDKGNEDIEKNKNDISTNSGKISTNEGNISSNLSKIDTNKNDISTNSCEISTNKGNISSNLSKIDTNKNDISTNLIKINSNEDDILYNLSEINYIKNNSSKSYIKNIYNILFYDKKTQINFKKDVFYKKVFDIDSSKNDFIEMKFKIDLQYDDISERNYVKTIYQLLDENNNSLYIKSVTNDDYTYFSNRVIIDENIFYNFNKDIKKIKFIIKFQKLLSSRVIYLYYIKNENYRFILKHYSL